MLVRTVRAETGLSIRAVADAAGLAPSTIHRIERGALQPTMLTLARIAGAAGMRLHVDVRVDYAASLVGLGRWAATKIVTGSEPDIVRLAAELVHRYRASPPSMRSSMISAEPAATGDLRWDAFLAALAEWLAVTSGDPVPAWARRQGRFLACGWWVTSMGSMRAWEYAGSPAAFKIRGVYVHRDSLLNV